MPWKTSEAALLIFELHNDMSEKVLQRVPYQIQKTLHLQSVLQLWSRIRTSLLIGQQRPMDSHAGYKGGQLHVWQFKGYVLDIMMFYDVIPNGLILSRDVTSTKKPLPLPLSWSVPRRRYRHRYPKHVSVIVCVIERPAPLAFPLPLTFTKKICGNPKFKLFNMIKYLFRSQFSTDLKNHRRLNLCLSALQKLIETSAQCRRLILVQPVVFMNHLKDDLCRRQPLFTKLCWNYLHV